MTNHILHNPDAAEGGTAILDQKPEVQTQTPEVGATTNWWDTLDDDTRNHASLQKFKTQDGGFDAAKIVASYRELESHLGKRPQAPEPAISPEAYRSSAQLPDGLDMDSDALGEMRKFMHSELKLPADVGSKLLDKYFEVEGGRYAKSQEAMKQAREQGMEKLSESWGDKTQENIDSVVRFLNNNFEAAVVQEINSSGLGNSPTFIAAMHNLAKNFSEDNSAPTSGAEPFKYARPQDKINALKADAEKMRILFREPGHRDHAAIKKEWDEAHAALTGKLS